jgi:hypothetical protein
MTATSGANEISKETLSGGFKPINFQYCIKGSNKYCNHKDKLLYWVKR